MGNTVNCNGKKSGICLYDLPAIMRCRISMQYDLSIIDTLVVYFLQSIKKAMTKTLYIIFLHALVLYNSFSKLI